MWRMTFIVAMVVPFQALTSAEARTEASKLRLKKLTSAEVVTWSDKAKKPRLVVLFQKGCMACRKQSQEFSCINKFADVSLLGGFSSETLLRNELVQMSNGWRVAYFADKEAMEHFGFESSVTPQLVAVSNGNKKRYVGYHSCDQVKSFLGLGREKL